MKSLFTKKKTISMIVIAVFLIVTIFSCGSENDKENVPIAVTGVTLDVNKITLEIGEERSLIPNVAPENANNKDVKWETNNSDVASVFNGRVTAKSSGTATITVSTWDGDFKDFCELTVPFQTVTGIKFNQKTFVVSFDQRVVVPYTFEPVTASNQNVTWTSSKPEVAEVGKDNILIPKLSGSTILTVTTEEGGFSDNCEVIVTSYWTAIADSSTKTLITGFFNNNPGYFMRGVSGSGDSGFEYWPNAHCLDVVIDAFNRTKDTYYSNIFDRWYTGVHQRNGNTFLNRYYDDMAWSALAMLRIYDLTRDQKWLTACRTVWNDMKGGWNSHNGGGIMWRKNGNDTEKNACTNGPAAILAARLYQITGNTEDLQWAHNIYNWQRATLYDNTPGNNFGRIWDHIRDNGVLQNWFFSYNQGTHIGAAVELYNITKDMKYIADAIASANYMINNLVDASDRSVLRASGDLGDGSLFNGIGIRYLAQLAVCDAISESDRTRYVNFIRYNATSLWNKAIWRRQPGPLTLIGRSWIFPPTSLCTSPNNENTCTTGVSFKSQASGGMLIEACALLEMKNLFNH